MSHFNKQYLILFFGVVVICTGYMICIILSENPGNFKFKEWEDPLIHHMDSSTNAALKYLDSSHKAVMKKVNESSRLQLQIDSMLRIYEKRKRKLHQLKMKGYPGYYELGKNSIFIDTAIQNDVRNQIQLLKNHADTAN